MSALVLALVLASSDGGTDAPYVDVDAGVYQVVSSTLADGGRVGPGWHLTPQRVVAVASFVTRVGNEKARAEIERDSARIERDEARSGRVVIFLLGLTTGAVVGGGLIIFAGLTK